VIVEVPVLVVGGGPVGLSVAIGLQARGIRVLLIERKQTTTQHPKMDITNGRSMEHFRRIGIAERIRDIAVSREHSMDVVWVSRLSEWELARFRYPNYYDALASIQAKNDGSQPLEPNVRLSQVVLEPELTRVLQHSPLAEVRFGWALETCRQNGAGVTARIRECHTGQEQEVQCQLLAGCDGGGSRVREELGISCDGAHDIARIYMVHFRSESRELLQRFGPAWHYQSPVGGTLIAQDDRSVWTLHKPLRRSVDPGSVEPLRLVHESLGSVFPLEVLQANLWRPHLVVANGCGRGRIWMAGDAVHQYIPTGGYGMNTGMSDAVDLAWKFAAVLHGWGGPQLLPSIEAERRPVAVENCEAARRNNAVRNEIASSYDPVIHENSSRGADTRQAYGRRILELGNAENESLGIELGYRYRDSPIICQESEEPEWRLLDYIPSTWPGVRAPHVFLQDGTAIFDLLGSGFTLLRFAEGDGHALLEAAAARAVPLKLVDIRDPNAAQVYERRLVLVRPDQHVAWRGDTVPRNAMDIIDRVRGQEIRI